jgi:hypothetical protein
MAVILDTSRDLTLESLHQIARAGASCALSEAALDRVARRREEFLALCGTTKTATCTASRPSITWAQRPCSTQRAAKSCPASATNASCPDVMPPRTGESIAPWSPG